MQEARAFGSSRRPRSAASADSSARGAHTAVHSNANVTGASASAAARSRPTEAANAYRDPDANLPAGVDPLSATGWAPRPSSAPPVAVSDDGALGHADGLENSVLALLAAQLQARRGRGGPTAARLAPRRTPTHKPRFHTPHSRPL